MSATFASARSLRTLVAVVATTAIAPAAASAATPTTTPAPAPIAVTGQQTAVAPDAGLVSALTSLKVSVTKTGNSSVDDQGRFVFPVTGGALTPALVGTINHTGGLEFKNKFGVKFGIKSFVIDTRGKTPVLTAVPTVAGFGLGIRVPVATLSDLAVSQNPPATVVSATLKFTQIGAAYVDLFIGKRAVKEGSLFGTAQASVTLAGSSVS